MIASRKKERPDPRSVLQGMLLLACGRREGIECFRGTPDAFLAAISPGVAINLVSLLLVLAQGANAVNLTKVMLSFCVLLAPPVISHAYARFWGREADWLRYATAAAWCEWVTVLVSIVVSILASLMVPNLARQPGFGQALLFSAEAYGVWLGWFVARTGLRLSRLRAFLLYITMLGFALGSYGLASILPPHHNFFDDLLKPVTLSQGKAQ